MSAWGTAAKSCNALLLRVEQNDPSLTELVILPSKTFGGPEVERLAFALLQGRNTHLTTLSASGHDIPPASLELLGQALGTSSCLKRIAVGDKTMGNEGVLALFGETGFGLLEGIDLAYKNISDGMRVLGTALGKSPCLVELNLSRNPFGDEGLVAFCDAAGTNTLNLPSLQYLNLSECHIGTRGLESLSKLLMQTGCFSLSLSSNPLGPNAASSLQALMRHGKVRSMVLKSCTLGDAGMAGICQEGASLDIKVLDLSDNQVGIEGALHLAESLATWKSLTELNLANNAIGPEGVVAISGALNGLETLDATNTDCGILGAVSLIRATGLKRLRLFNNKLKSEGFEELAALVSDIKLLELDLGGNEASAEGVLTLLRKIRTTERTSLILLEIGANETTMEVEAEIKRIKEVHPYLDIARDRARQET